MIIVGSQALAHFEYNRAEPKDLDIWFSKPNFKIDSVELLKVLELDKKTIIDKHYIPDYIINLIPRYFNYATPDAVYTIACSHLAWDIHWEKTKNTILYLKSKGCQLIPDLYCELKRYWLIEHSNKDFLSLNKPKEMFFNDYVHYQIPHDFLHEIISFPNKPIYTYCLKENEDVLIDKNKFDNLDFDSKVRMFREEITVIACERWLLNTKNKEADSWYKAYMLSLKKVIISLTKNWANDFIIHNLELFVKPDYSYFKNLLETLKMQEEIDLSPFEELQFAFGTEKDLDTLVYALCIDESMYYYIDDVFEDLEYNQKNHNFDEILKTFDYELLDFKGGAEGEGEYCYGVFKLKDKIYKAEYSYYSYNGDEYSAITYTLKVVTPKEKLITVYE